MTKKTTINKIISSKAFWIIISLLGSFLLWMYIMSTEETTIEKTFSNVKVVYQGADDLRAARGLIVTDADADSVTVRLKGTRRVLGNLSSADLSAVIDVSGISQAREMQVSYSLQYPTNVDKSSITVLSKSPETISFSVVQEMRSTASVCMSRARIWISPSHRPTAPMSCSIRTAISSSQRRFPETMTRSACRCRC